MIRGRPLSQTTATLMEIPSGSAGTRHTLRTMRRLVQQYKKDIRLRELALSLIYDLPGHKNWVGQIKRLHAYVRDTIQYVRDVRGVETIATPIKTMEYGAGDCDDQAVLLATLLESIGHPTRFVAMKSTTFGPYVHVYTETRVGDKWIPLETTEQFEAGHPMKHAGVMVEHN